MNFRTECHTLVMTRCRLLQKYNSTVLFEMVPVVSLLTS